jgi:hypothetical protein
MDLEIKIKNRSGLEFDLNSKEIENFKLIQRLMRTIRKQMT